jgi:hypothetical protein
VHIFQCISRCIAKAEVILDTLTLQFGVEILVYPVLKRLFIVCSATKSAYRFFIHRFLFRAHVLLLLQMLFIVTLRT